MKDALIEDTITADPTDGPTDRRARASWPSVTPDQERSGRTDRTLHAPSIGRDGAHAPPIAQVRNAIRRGQDFLFTTQRQEQFWCAELESNVSITAEWVLMHQMLGLDINHEPHRPAALNQTPRVERVLRYLRSQQNPDGSFGIASTVDGDVSTTAETYLAMRILGLEENDPHLLRTQKYILDTGGLEKMRIFTRIFFAMFGLLPWSAIPAIPPEFMLLPAQSPVNIYSLSSWARGTMIPLFVISHYRPSFALPNGKSAKNTFLDHLWLNPADKNIPYAPPWHHTAFKKGLGFETLFGTADKALRVYEPFKLKPVRKRAIKKCIDYILDHQEESGDWAGIFPPMMNGVLALVLHGYALDSDPIVRGLKAMENFSWEDAGGFRIQACVSPVWDTAWSLIGLIDGHVKRDDPRLKGAVDWMLKNQINVDYGDWKVYRPHLISGGWAFEYHNTWYPDVDDTAAVLISLLKQDPNCLHLSSTVRAIEWMLGMQNRDGGWAAFDVNNDKLFLNKIPFSDMDSLCDTSCADITGRVIESFALYFKLAQSAKTPIDQNLARRMRAACERGVMYLRQTQEADGSWFGRWGVNYVYGTIHALAGLADFGVPVSDPMVQKALSFVKSTQNADGGWGESVKSYDCKAFVAAPSTASQTAWGLIGLLAYLPGTDKAVARGAKWLVQNQVDATEEMSFEGGVSLPLSGGGTWSETEPTGTGFPQHFYLRYHLYRHAFPMIALGRYLASREN